MLNTALRVTLLLFLFCLLHLMKFHTKWIITICINLEQKNRSLNFF